MRERNWIETGKGEEGGPGEAGPEGAGCLVGGASGVYFLSSLGLPLADSPEMGK